MAFVSRQKNNPREEGDLYLTPKKNLFRVALPLTGTVENEEAASVRCGLF
jgi:hypothetical protein